MEGVHSLNLRSYFSRVDYRGDLSPSLSTLQGLHRAHALHIPFENLDIPAGRPIRLDLPSLQAKLVDARRGGYCFEQNGLFAAVLEELGFAVRRLVARIRFIPGLTLPRTHMVLRVEIDGCAWLADVGFGGWGLIEPMELADGATSQQGPWKYRIQREEVGWLLQSPGCPLGDDLYAFTEEPQLPVDYEIANYYTSTHPESRFVQNLIAQRVLPDRRLSLRGTDFVTITENGEQVERIIDSAHLRKILREQFELDLPEDMKIPFPFPPKLAECP